MAARTRRLGIGLNWAGLAVVVGVLGLWQLVVSTGVLSYHSLPGPDGVWRGLRSLARNDLLWPEIGHTLKAVLLAWAIAVSIGAFVGLLVGVNRTLASWAGATVEVFRSLPVVSFVPIAILLWGTATKAEVIVGAYAALWPMLVNTAAAARAIPPRLHDVARSLRLSRASTMLKVLTPATGAAMIVGARLSLGVALVVCVVTEMIGPPLGLGHGVVFEQSSDQPERMWAYVLLVGILGIALNAVLVRVLSLAFPGVAALANRNRR